MDNFNDMQSVKRSFFAMRNGIVADALRKAGSPYEMIFGLNLPQIKDIASRLGVNTPLAVKLRDDIRTRESQLLAPMIIAPDTISSSEDALEWIRAMRSQEAIDILCIKALKDKEFALEIVRRTLASDTPLCQYAAMRLLWNIYTRFPLPTEEIIRNHQFQTPSLELMRTNLLEEIDFLRS